MDYAKHIIDAGDILAQAVKEEMTLEDTRAHVKFAAIERIMKSGDNPLTGKPHSASSAEAVVNLDEEYAAHLTQQRDAVARKIRAKAQYDAAVAAARLKAEAVA
jgi:hypothetical protein